MDIFNMVGDMTTWLIFFFFIYEVKSVIVVLSSSQMHEMGQALKRTQREKYIVVGVTFFLSIIYHGIAAIMLTMNNWFKESAETFNRISSVSRIGYMICFLYLLIMWFHLVHQFI